MFPSGKCLSLEEGRRYREETGKIVESYTDRFTTIITIARFFSRW
jgi:hypothetical protein